MVTTPKNKAKCIKRKNVKVVDTGPTQKKQQHENKICFFCNREGYTKKGCTKCHDWCVKKDTFLILVCFKVDLALVSRNILWVDSSATTHTSVSIQGCLSYQKSVDGERHLFRGHKKKKEKNRLK